MQTGWWGTGWARAELVRARTCWSVGVWSDGLAPTAGGCARVRVMSIVTAHKRYRSPLSLTRITELSAAHTPSQRHSHPLPAHAIHAVALSRPPLPSPSGARPSLRIRPTPPSSPLPLQHMIRYPVMSTPRAHCLTRRLPGHTPLSYALRAQSCTHASDHHAVSPMGPAVSS